MNADYLVYAAHAGFWMAFGVTHRFFGPGSAARPDVAAGGSLPASDLAAATARTAPFSRALLAVHFAAFGSMYAGIGGAVVPHRVPQWFPGQRIAGALLIAAGAVAMCWSLVYFRSWRFRARIDAGHELATEGPFALVRHPIYAGMNLLAIGTAIWVPDFLCWLAVVFMVLGSDLRGRAEERLLREAFGEAYDRYRARTRRFIPGVY